MIDYFIPILIVALLVAALIKRVNAYDAFVAGAKESFSLSIGLLPYIAAIFIAVNIMREAGADKLIVAVFAPPFRLLGIPRELVELVALRPLSGSGSLALLSEIYQLHGADSYISRCASVIMGSTETVFYVAALYFSKAKIKNFLPALLIALVSSFLGCILACALCKIM